tara:strand:- start:14311 stop:14808 length:498 start_codon:yes stop_codon:yes gene_type:complete
MVIKSIDKILDLGLNSINSSVKYRNSINTFKYVGNIFYSYNEPIGFHYVKDNGELSFNVYGKTAKYGNYFSQTTSKHIGWLIQKVRTSDYKDNWNLIDMNDNIISISGKKDKGSVYVGSIECPICYDNFEKGIILKCGHKFCKGCIGKWLKDKSTCPYCKGSIYI